MPENDPAETDPIAPYRPDIDPFRRHLRAENESQRITEIYVGAITKFARWLVDKTDCADWEDVEGRDGPRMRSTSSNSPPRSAAGGPWRPPGRRPRPVPFGSGRSSDPSPRSAG